MITRRITSIKNGEYKLYDDYNLRLIDPEDTRAKKHLSVTQLKMFLRCPLQYKFRYIDGLKIPPPSYITLGKSVHSALEENFRQKIESHRDLPLEQLTDLFSDSWEKKASETLFEEDEKPGKIKDEGIGLVKVYHREVAPNIQPVYVEKGFGLLIDNIKYPLIGYIDLVDDNRCIIDHKTAKRSFPKDVVDKDLQLTAYAMAYRQMTGREESGVRFNVAVRTKEPKIQPLSSTRSQKDIYRFLRVLEHVSKAMETGIFYPNEGYQCAACGYREQCERW